MLKFASKSLDLLHTTFYNYRKVYKVFANSEEPKMKKSIITALALCVLVFFTGCGNAPKNAENDKNTKPAAATTEQAKPDNNTKGQKALGAITPEQALEYMKKTKDLVIIDVAPSKAYEKERFNGSINIPLDSVSKEEETKRYKEIPKGKPVLIHCRKGIFAPGAYKRIIELRPDIPEISYINGAPLFKPYNEWVNTQGR
jgi:rhodanese-related sulfurtransferase